MTADSGADRVVETTASARRGDRHRRRLRPGRKHTLGRRGVILASVGLIALGAFVLVASLGGEREAGSPTWFAGYVDVTLDPGYSFETGPEKDVILAFVVASPADYCLPSWGSRYSFDGAAQAVDLDNRLAEHRARGGRVAVSFGGSLNLELANACLDEGAVALAYRQVLDSYNPVALDFDIEGDNLLDAAAGVRRANVVSRLQREETALGRKLEVWVTLPASPKGLTDAGVNAVEQMLAAGVELAGVNVMTMNYGASRPAAEDMLESSISAANAAHDQLSALYERQGLGLSSDEVWQKLGLTPMIGQNDLPGEVFALAAAQKLRAFALDKGVQRLSMWSLNRDVSCPEGSLPATASHVCSGVSQRPGQFAEILGNGLNGRMG
ncbi:chitinase [Arthrobacter sp. B3I4]|uniref:chitinase n=1 Tax=Arthrobacter sp. B3I4 TaxID=3042267 RepID=UPI002788AE65|nr:chitinase [Arthrobacter sp. B3I4]MDQ0757131.1 chitinase [Arthrobacter sp. B3I4]